MNPILNSVVEPTAATRETQFAPDEPTVRNTETDQVGATSAQPPTIEDALSQGLLPRTTVLAGHAGLSRPIVAALTLEAGDPETWLKGGELVFSSVGAPILGPDTPAGWRAFIEGLATARAAGLVVMSRQEPRLIPEEALACADRLGLPLLARAGNEALVDVLRPIQDAIETGRASGPREGLVMQRRLMQLVLDGNGLDAVIKFLARQLGHAVVVEDKQFNLLAFATPGNAPEPALDDLVSNKGTPLPLMKRWEEDGTLRDLRAHRTARMVAGPPPRWIHPVVIAGEVYGYCSVLAQGPFDEGRREAMEHGLTAIAIELLKQKGANESEQKMKRDFFRDLLLATTSAMMEPLRRRATYLGFPPNASYWAIQVEFDDPRTGMGAVHDEVQADDLNRLVGILNALLSFRQAVVVNQPQGATILYPVKEGQPSKEKIQHLTRAIHQKVGAASPVGRGPGQAPWSVSIGVGQIYPELLGVPKAFREAQHALKIGRSTSGPNAITFFADLGIYRMLLQFAQSQDPNEFYCEPLQRLIEYNQQTDKELVKTIAAFLACNGNLTETSAKLYIHRNTLKYRLERIRDITQIDLDDAENRLMLHLGLKMNQVINYLR